MVLADRLNIQMSQFFKKAFITFIVSDLNKNLKAKDVQRTIFLCVRNIACTSRFNHAAPNTHIVRNSVCFKECFPSFFDSSFFFLLSYNHFSVVVESMLTMFPLLHIRYRGYCHCNGLHDGIKDLDYLGLFQRNFSSVQFQHCFLRANVCCVFDFQL